MEKGKTAQKTGITAFIERGERIRTRGRSRRRLLTYQRKLLLSAALLLIGMSIGGFMGMNVFADEAIAPNLKPYYTSIRVEEGDSLWSIASRYFAESPMDIREYIYELKRINQLTDDTIHTGHYLMVVYYK